MSFNPAEDFGAAVGKVITAALHQVAQEVIPAAAGAVAGLLPVTVTVGPITIAPITITVAGGIKPDYPLSSHEIGSGKPVPRGV